MYASFQASPSLTYIAVESSVPFFWPSHVPLAVPLIVRISTVGEIAVAWPSLTFTLVMPSHFIVSVHSLIASALEAWKPPIGSMKPKLDARLLLKKLASLDLKASHPA